MNGLPLGSSCPERAHQSGGGSPGAAAPSHGALPRPRPTPALVAEACTPQLPLLGMLLRSPVLLPAPTTPSPSCPAQPQPWLLSSPKAVLGAGQSVFLTPSSNSPPCCSAPRQPLQLPSPPSHEHGPCDHRSSRPPGHTAVVPLEHLHGVRQAHRDRHRALSSDPSCRAG